MMNGVGEREKMERLIMEEVITSTPFYLTDSSNAFLIFL